MKNTRNKLFKVAAILLIAGLLISFGSMIAIGFDFSKLDKNSYNEKSYTFTEDISSLSVTTIEADLNIIASESDSIKVSCMEKAENPFSIKVVNGTLTIGNHKKQLLDYLDIFSFTTPEITIELPAKKYSTIFADNTTGDISVSSLEASDIIIDSGTGSIDLCDVKCDNLELELSTGDICLERVSAVNYIEIESTTGDIDLNLALCKGEMEIECTTGDITFSNSDANYISAETTTGDITGTLVTEKTFYTKTTTGDINVPDSTAENICELETTTGDIDIKIAIN